MTEANTCRCCRVSGNTAGPYAIHPAHGNDSRG